MGEGWRKERKETGKDKDIKRRLLFLSFRRLGLVSSFPFRFLSFSPSSPFMFLQENAERSEDLTTCLFFPLSISSRTVFSLSVGVLCLSTPTKGKGREDVLKRREDSGEESSG